VLEETQNQLRELTRELVDLRKQNELLKEQNRKIPEFEDKIRSLSKSLEEELCKRSVEKADLIQQSQTGSSHGSLSSDMQHDGSLASLLNEITHLKSSLSVKESVEKELRRELVHMKSSTNLQEFKCKQIISSCVGIPIESIETLLDPLLRAVESDDPADLLDMGQVSSFIHRIKDLNKASPIL
jgi:regulatory protein SWI6